MDTVRGNDDGEAICGGASASLLVVNRQELQLASTPCSSKTIVVKSGKHTSEGMHFFLLLGKASCTLPQPQNLR